MKRLVFYFVLMLLTITFSCGNKAVEDDKTSDSILLKVKDNGDSTLYGLACDGCTDSVLIFLSFDGGDPVTFDILNASRNKRVIGHPEAGDWVGVVLNKDDRKKADLVIDLDQLKGTWVYMAVPKPRERKVKEMNVYVDQRRQDSILKAYMVPEEQGFALKRNSVAAPVGYVFARNNDEECPVVYPEVKFYTDWGIFNGRLVLSGKRMNASSEMKSRGDTLVSDTAEFIFMMKDSLQLRFKDGVRCYYRK